MNRLLLLCLPVLGACSLLPAAKDPDSATTQQKADRVEREVSRIRDLPQKAKVPAGEKSKDQLLEVMKGEVDKDWNENHREFEERAYKVFGLLPADFDLKSFTAELMRDQVAGYYDPEKKEFFTVKTKESSAQGDTTGSSVERAEGKPKKRAKKDDDSLSEIASDLDASLTMPHELTHALEDQHFDLLAKQKAAAGDDDRATALLGLVEGSAMEGGIEHVLDRAGVPISSTGPIGRTVIHLVGRPGAGNPATSTDSDSLSGSDAENLEKLKKAPPIMSWTLQFPYLSGWRFVNTIRSEYGWEAVNQMYADPPESTEQILYPERYIDRRDRPQKITLAEAPAGWKKDYEQTLGFLSMRILLNAMLDDDLLDSKATGVEFADGWDGDRYALLSQGNRDAMAWVVAFDEEGQASTFAGGWRKALRKRFGDTGTWAIETKDNVVASAWSLPAGEAAAVAKSYLENSKVESQPGDVNPDRWYWDVLRWPIAVQVFDRSWQWNVLGGYAIHLRSHSGGHLLHLGGGLVLESENNPDRNMFWCALGLVGYHHDRTIDATFWRIPFLHNGHFRGDGEDYRSQYGLALDSLLYSNRLGKKHIGVLWDFLFDINWGKLDEDDAHLRFLRLPLWRS